MSSDGLSFDIHVFACGHGDTILLRLPDNRWSLVDCNLPKAGGIRDRFFGFLADHRINRLDYIFQTHPDTDHFHGMVEVLDYFTSNDRTVGWWCDGGLNSRDVRDFIWPDDLSRRQYARLQHRLDELDDRGGVARSRR